jgi:hypothetical protein
MVLIEYIGETKSSGCSGCGSSKSTKLTNSKTYAYIDAGFVKRTTFVKGQPVTVSESAANFLTNLTVSGKKVFQYA